MFHCDLSLVRPRRDDPFARLGRDDPFARLGREQPFARLGRDDNPFARRWRGRLLRCLILAGLLLAAVPALGVPFGDDPEAAAALLEELGDDYRVLTLSDSYLLQPADQDAGFDAIEIKAGSVAVDGEIVTGDQLRDLVGDTAATILDISRLGTAEGSRTEELRQRIERLAEEQRLKAEELESLEAEHLEALEETLEEQHRDQRRRDQLRDERRGERQGRRRRGSVRTDTRVSFGSSLTVEDNETSRDVVVLGGSLDVEGKVRGDAVVVGGSAEIRGEVSGTVTAIGGSISLGPGARIEGDAISIGGAVHRDPTAEVYGEISEVSLGPGFELDDLWDGMWIPHWHFDWFDFGLGELFGRISRTVALAVLLLLVMLLLPRLTTAVCERVQRAPWTSVLVGLLAEILLLILVVPVVAIVVLILAVTVIGLPFALMLFLAAPLAVAVLFYLGLAGVAQACGHLLEDRFDRRGLSPYLLVILGVALIQGTSILGGVLGIVGGPLRFIAWMVLLLGFLIKYVAWTTGLGAILMHYLSPGLAIARPVPPGPAAPMPAGPLRPAGGGRMDGFVPPQPAPTGWEDTAVDKESEEIVDPDEEYVEAGPPLPPPPELTEPIVLTDEDYLEAGTGSGAAGEGESEESEDSADESEESESIEEEDSKASQDD